MLGERSDQRGLWEADPEANELLRSIHNRMPVILPRGMESFWLDHEVEDSGVLSSALVPHPGEEMEAYEVSSLVNRPANDWPEVVLPVGPETVASANQQRQRPLL